MGASGITGPTVPATGPPAEPDICAETSDVYPPATDCARKFAIHQGLLAHEAPVDPAQDYDDKHNGSGYKHLHRRVIAMPDIRPTVGSSALV